MKHRRTLIIAGVVAGVLAVGLLLGAVVPGLRGTKPADQVGSAPFDRADFDAYWNTVIPETRGLVTSIDFDGQALTAHTRLVADADAVDPAMKICTALALYWPQAHQDPHGVRVFDQAQQILTSRYVTDDRCHWRR